MQYLHSKRFVHRDLKPSNILVKPLNKTSGYMTIKLRNFGIAKPYNHIAISSLQTTNKGTPMYASLEMIFGPSTSMQKKNKNPKLLTMVDVWSFAMICSKILSSQSPFKEGSKASVQNNIKNSNFWPILPKDCLVYLCFCITYCWEYYPNDWPKFFNLCTMLNLAKIVSLGITCLASCGQLFSHEQCLYN